MPRAAPTLEILAAAGRHTPLARILRDTGMSYAQGYGLARRLHARGLLRLRRVGPELVVDPMEPRIPRESRRLLEDPPRKGWGPLFAGSRPEAFAVLDRVGSVVLAADVMGMTRAALHKAAQDWKDQGILEGSGSHHHATRPDIREFLDGYCRCKALHRLRSIDPDAELRWHLGPELLFWTPHSALRPPAVPAGPSAAAAHGVTTFGPGSHGALTRRVFDAADAALQTLLVGANDPLLRSAAALLAEKAGFDLRRKAALYGLQAAVDEVQAYVGGAADRPGFLPWGEHEAMRQLYGIPLDRS